MDGMMFASDPFEDWLDTDNTHVSAEMYGGASAGEFPRPGNGSMGIAASQMARDSAVEMFPPAQDGAGSMYMQGSRGSGDDKYSMVHQPSQHGAMMAQHQHQYQQQQEDIYHRGGSYEDFSAGQQHHQQNQPPAAYLGYVGGVTRGDVMQGPAQSMGGAAAMRSPGPGGGGSGYGQQQLLPEKMIQMQQMQQQMHRQQQHHRQQQQQQQQQQGPPHGMTHAQHHPRLQQQQHQQQHQQQQHHHHHHLHHRPLDAGNASTSPVPHSGMSPAVSMIPSHQGHSMSQQQIVQGMHRVFNHVQKCQSHISEAMHKSSALKMNLQEMAPEVSRQLQQYMPDTFIPAVAQTFTAATEEIAGYLNMGPDGSDRSMGYGPMDGQAGAMAQLRGQQQQMQQQQMRPGASWQKNSSMSPVPMSPHDGSAVSLQAGHPQRGEMMSYQPGGQHGRVIPQGMGHPPAGIHQSQSQAEWPYGDMSGQMQHSARSDMGRGQDDVVILSQSGTFSSDLPHARAHCTKKPFKIVKDRLGEEGGQGNEQYCENCFCYVCDVRASECQGWLRVGHCHANEKESFWRALREFTSREVLCNSPLLQAMGCDEQMQMEAHKSCINGLLAFHSYRTGEEGPRGVVQHHFQHVTDAASSVMKMIIGHLSDPKGPKITLAILDGITSAMVVNSWQPSPTQGTANHKWPSNTLEAYKVILEQLEKYWILAIVRTSTRSVPPPAIEVMANRLRELSKLAREKIPDVAEGEYSPLSQAIIASERGWKHPVVVAILDGQCTDVTQGESQVLQWARLHLLEHAQRWKEAYHYALFHGRVAKSLAFLVRAGRHADVLPMVLSQSAIAAYSKCLNVCQELVSANQANSAIRLAMFCAFGNYEAKLDEEALQRIRLSYVDWILGHLIGQMTQDEFKARNSFDIVSPNALEARAAAESWAQDVLTDLAKNFLQPLPEPPEYAMYSSSSLSMERVAALCALGMPRLALGCAKLFSSLGDHFGALSVVILAVLQADDAVIKFGVQELLPQVGKTAFMATTERWKNAELGYAGKMSVASLLLELEEHDEAIRFAADANLIGAPNEDDIVTADFSSPREYRICDLMPFISCAQTRDVDSALLLARLQMWWDPSWSHFQAIASMCSAHEADMHRQQLQTLVYTNMSCRPEVRFEVLVREGMVQQAVRLIEEIVKPQNTVSFKVLRDCFNVLGSEFFSQNSAVLDALWPLLQETVQQTPEIDVAMEVLVIATPQRALNLYDCNLETCQQQCQQHAVNAASKANLRNWLIRTKRMYLAAGQNIEWERRLKDISSSLKRKSSVSSIFAEVAEPGQIMSPGTPGMTERSSSRPAKSSRSNGSVSASPMSQSVPSTPMPITPMPVTPMPSTPAYQ